MPDDWTPDQPLHDSRHERFSASVAGGTALSDAYAATGTGKLQPNVAKSNGWRLAQKPNIAARIEYLRLEAVNAREGSTIVFDRATINQLLGEVTLSFETAINSLEKVGGNPATVAKLREALLLHAGRVFRQPRAKPQRKNDGPDYIRDGMTRLQICECEQQ